MELDLIIIGAGPAGVTSAIYAKRAGLKFIIIEKMAVGGQARDAGLIENYPGYNAISGLDLAQHFKNQLVNLKVDIIYDDVVEIKKENIFLVNTLSNKYSAKSVIIATGASPKKLNLENESKLLGQGVSYCAYCDGAFFKDEDVAVIGSGNSACEAALYLANIAKNVNLLSNINNLSAEATTVDIIKKTKNIKVHYEANITNIGASKLGVNQIEYTQNNNAKLLNITGLFIYIGHISNSDLLKKNYPSLIDTNGGIKTHNTTTTIPGLFVAGDCASKKIKQIVTAASDGATALINVLGYLKTIK